MPENEINFTFEGTPEEIGVDAAIKLLAPVIEGVAHADPSQCFGLSAPFTM